MSRRSTAIVLSPEAPWPVVGGGALRTASVVEYLRARHQTTVITFRDPGAPDPRISVPADVECHVIDLPPHSKQPAVRVLRNAKRWARGIPPLVDRFAGFGEQMRSAIGGRHFDVGVIEHFWCAPYAAVLRAACRRLVLDVHNVESVLLSRQADLLPLPASLAFRRFSSAAESMERLWTEQFDIVLVTSETDRAQLGTGVVYPNAVPEVPQPTPEKVAAIAFSGNFEYNPNFTAVQWFARHVWPDLRGRQPDLRWWLIGRNDFAIRKFVADDPRVHVTGAVDDAIAELARTQVAIVPVQAGSGTRIKIIEAWVAGLPVVSTRIGAEGLPVTHREEIMLADTPAEFGAAIEEILYAPELRKRLGTAGRRLYEQQLTWPAVWQVLDRLGL